MGELIELPIVDLMRYCNLILGVEENFPARCYGYPEECKNCEVKRYLSSKDLKEKYMQKLIKHSI